MKRSTIFLTLIPVFLSAVCTSCYYNTPEEPVFQVTQQQLDAATILAAPQDTTIMGDPFNAFGADTVTTKHKMRDLFQNISLPKDVTVGTIMTRRAYYYPWVNNKRDSLINIVVMVKRERGYYPEGGDWEYMDIKYDKTTDYDKNPNGILPMLSNDIIRGRIVKCATCHARVGGNFLFHGN